ncbi:MAG: molybdopterin-dependent oxidoreductase, partial [Maritimibacter sp.]|nr:molybdopterin-dependent oxidoreductase [Maritimibacter sp.]
RILPRNHDGVNEEWISDKTRFVWDGLRRQRLDRPYVRKGGKLQPATWPEALSAAAKAIKGATKLAGLVGDLASAEAAFSLKQLVEGQGGNVECRVDGAKLPEGNRSAYVGTATIEDVEAAKYMMLIGTNPRDEAPVLNARIRKAWLNGANIGLIGEPVDLTYDYVSMGTDREALQKLADYPFGEVIDLPSVMIVGQGALNEADGEAVLALVMQACERSNSKLLVLHTAAGRVGAMDVGAVTKGGLKAATEGADVVFNMGADELEIEAGAKVIYLGSHGDRGAHRADVILPAAAYTEEAGIFVNTEGRPQMALRASFPPGEAKETWAILRALSAELGATQPWDTHSGLRSAMFSAVPHLHRLDEVQENAWKAVKPKTLGKADFRNAIKEFYLTNPIARASALMGELQAMAAARTAEDIAAE